MRAIRSLVISLSCLIFVIIITHSNITRPRILVVHAYDTTYAWTRDLNIGLQNIFTNYKQYQIMYHYMDTKRHPEEDFVKKAGLIARNLVDSIRPAILLTVNNDAQNYVGRFYVNHPTIKLVYTGVNGRAETYGYDRGKNVTGLLQRIPLGGLRDVVLELAKMRKLTGPIRIVHLSDNSSVVHDDDSYFRDEDHPLTWWAPIIVTTPSYLVSTFDEWKQMVGKAQKEADFIIISNYRRIYQKAGAEDKVPPAEVMSWTVQNSRVPIIGLNAFVSEDGAGLSVAASPIEQGEISARKAVELLTTDKPVTEIPVEKTKHYLVCIRKKMMEKDFHLPLVYENFARYAKEFWD